MTTIHRRRLLAMAAALGASAAWSRGEAAPSPRAWTERRDLYPEGVASGDPQADSVILWTRRAPQPGEAAPKLTVEVAEDAAFQRVVATAPARASADSDWTTRVLVGNLKPRHVYYYRFIDAAGQGSRIGRTVTAPRPGDDATVRFTFVSCQNANQGAMNAYRRMIWEDERAPEDQRLDFVLHLGDFIYEIVWYPEDRPKGMYDRRLRDVVRYANGQKVGDFHVPTTLDDYRAVYRGYLRDPDLQDARARWPFVVMWDNHEFSWRGIQSIVRLGNEKIWGQTRKVAANQAWFEFQPARVKHAGNLDRFGAPKVADVPVTAFDEHGLGTEPNNLAAVNSLIAYRALRFGKHMDLVLTDHHSFRSDDPGEDPAAADLGERDFPYMVPEELTQALDYGRTYPGGPPAKLAFGPTIDNFRKDAPPVTILGATQKAWLKKTLAGSTATWKVWGCTNGALDVRTDPQNLPQGLVKPWPGAGYANSGGGDFSGAFAERDELYDFVRDRGVEGFAIVSGDRHSFWAGLAAKALPPKAFEPVGVAFITGSISAPGFAEGSEYNLKKTVPLRPLFLRDGPPAAKPEPVVNVLYRHGVRSALEYSRTGDMAAARKLSNPDLAPHLSFVDMAGHGYAKVTVDARAMETEFVCMPRPLERSATPDGGPLVYRVTHRAPLWRKGQRPRLEQRVLEGDPKLSI